VDGCVVTPQRQVESGDKSVQAGPRINGDRAAAGCFGLPQISKETQTSRDETGAEGRKLTVGHLRQDVFRGTWIRSPGATGAVLSLLPPENAHGELRKRYSCSACR